MDNIFDINRNQVVESENQPNGKNVIPVLEESLTIGKEVVETGKVIISKKVNEEEINVNVPVIHEEVTVDKVEVNKYVDTAPEIRYEGETMIVPVVKEVLVVEKRLMLTEELHIRKNRIERTEERVEIVRKEEVTVSREEV
jgi:uncharacterized protein (TIGR02271 family)